MTRPVGASFVAALVALSACSGTPEPDPAFVSEWMRTLYGAIRVERLSPPIASRLLVYATTPLYAGLAASDVEADLPPLSAFLNGFPELPVAEPGSRHDGPITAVAAQRVVLDSLLAEALPTTRAAVARLADSLDADRMILGVEPDVAARSRELGRRVGLAIVAWSRADGFDATRGRPYSVREGSGLWVNDAPPTIYASQNLSGATDFVALDNPANHLRPGLASDRGLILNRPKGSRLRALPVVNMAGTSEPYWGELRPFALERWDACALPEMPSFSSDSASPFWLEAMQVVDAQRSLTPEQRTTALFWADNAGESGTPPGHWIAIASQMVSQRRLSAADAARLVVLTAVAQADAFIASWGYKYRFSSIRPRAYIRSVIDSTWEPAIPSPPFPEYPSGHSTQSAAAAEVLSSVLGDAAFDDSTSIPLGHAVRRFPSFRAAAEEAGLSRIYGGIHFPFANSGGRALGACVGARVMERARQAIAR